MENTKLALVLARQHRCQDILERVISRKHPELRILSLKHNQNIIDCFSAILGYCDSEISSDELKYLFNEALKDYN